MPFKHLLFTFLVLMSLFASAQTQSWQWVKAGGSSSDNNSVQPAECKIAGCDAYGNVYERVEKASGNLNGRRHKRDACARESI